MTVEAKHTHGPTETRIHNIIISLSVAFTRLKVRLRLFISFIFIYQHVIRPLKHVQKPNQSAGTDRSKVKAHLNTLRHWNIPQSAFSATSLMTANMCFLQDVKPLTAYFPELKTKWQIFFFVLLICRGRRLNDEVPKFLSKYVPAPF